MSGDRDTQSQALVVMASMLDLFHDASGTAYASETIGQRKRTWVVRSGEFEKYLRHLFYCETKRPPSGNSMGEALANIEAMAEFDGPEQEVFRRVAISTDGMYIDLGTPDWSAVHVTPNGWNIVDRPSVAFVRTSGMGSLPIPTRDGDIGHLRPLVNVEDESDFQLLVGWVIAALRPHGPYPILNLSGEQGTAKSTTSRILRNLVDPNAAALKHMSRGQHDLMIAASRAHCLAYDNVSHLSSEMSDALCQVATGSAFATRELYTTAGEVTMHVQNPMILNGIGDLATRTDLLDRMIVIHLPQISTARRMSEQGLADAWNDYQGSIFGAICDALATALAREREVQIDDLPRMADSIRWVTASEDGLPWSSGSFHRAFNRQREAIHDYILDTSAISPFVRKMADEREPKARSATQLLKDFTRMAKQQSGFDDRDVTREPGWPKTAHHLSNTLARLAPHFRAVGIEIERSIREGQQRRLIRISRIASERSEEPTVPPSAVLEPDDADDQDDFGELTDEMLFQLADEVADLALSAQEAT